MENLGKRINVRWLMKLKTINTWLASSSFVSQKIFNKNVNAIHKIKPVLTLGKPIYVGFSILDLSRLLMYEFHYKYIKREYDAKLLFTDTGSLAYEIKTKKYIYEIFCKNKNLFDFSNYPKDSM